MAGGSPIATELTLRAVVTGCGIGLLLSIGNVYLGLTSGFVDSGSVTAVLVTFGLYAHLRNSSRALGPLESNVSQAAASAAAATSALAGLLGAFPGLALLGHRYPAWVLTAWALLLGGLGTLVAVPLRRQLLERERLPFPTGMAVANLIEALHWRGESARGRNVGLAAGALAGGAIQWLRSKLELIPSTLVLPGELGGVPVSKLTLGLSTSPVLLAVGALVGPRIGASLFLAAVLAWGVGGPWLASAGAVTEPSYDAFVAWLLWPGMGLSLGATGVSLVIDRGLIARALGDLRGTLRSTHGAIAAAALSLCAAAAAFGWCAFDMPLHLSLFAIVLSIFLAGVCGRAAGETDIVPASPAGQVAVLVSGPLSPGSAPSMAAGSATGNGVATATLLWSFRAGQLVGSDPKRLLIAQLCGIAVGTAVAVPAYVLLDRAYRLGSPELPAPFARLWQGAAELASHGLGSVPASALLAAAAGLFIGGALALLSRRWQWLPSPVALGMGLLLPASFAATVFLGAIAVVLLRQTRPSWAERHATSAAAGIIVGESLVGLGLAAASSLL